MNDLVGFIEYLDKIPNNKISQEIYLLFQTMNSNFQLGVPAVSLTSYDTYVVCWSKAKFYLEFEVYSDATFDVYGRDRSKEKGWASENSIDRDQLSKLYFDSIRSLIQ